MGEVPRPLVSFSDTTHWGVGQPSAITVNQRAGVAVLFYTEGNSTGTYAYRNVLAVDGALHPDAPPLRRYRPPAAG